MDIYVKPNELINVKNEIKRLHTRTYKTNFNHQDEVLEALVRMVAGWNPLKLDALIKILDKNQVTMLCLYVANNYYEVDRKNICEVIRTSATGNDCFLLLNDWENHYDENEVRKLLINCLEEKTDFVCELQDKNINVVDFASWIKKDSFIKQIGYYAKKVNRLSDFHTFIQRIGVVKDTQLYLRCIEEFYLYCSKPAYINAGDIVLAKCYEGYSSNQKRLFIHNLLKRLDLSDLKEFKNVHQVVENSITNKTRESFEKELEADNLLQKYLYWKKLLAVQIIGDKERIDFWMQYALGAEIVFVQTSMLIYMVFGDYVVTEFCNKGSGPAYIMKKSYFENHMMWKAKITPREKMRQDIYDLYKTGVQGILERMPHQGDWQWIFAATLRNKCEIYPISIK